MSAKQKTKWLRSEPYLAWVRTQPSAVSGKMGCVAHHLIGHGRCGTEKTHDYWAIPLTDAEHKELHDKGWKWFEAKYCSQFVLACQTLGRATETGVLKKTIPAEFRFSGDEENVCNQYIVYLNSTLITVNKKAALGRENVF